MRISKMQQTLIFVGLSLFLVRLVRFFPQRKSRGGKRNEKRSNKAQRKHKESVSLQGGKRTKRTMASQKPLKPCKNRDFVIVRMRTTANSKAHSNLPAGVDAGEDRQPREVTK